jgi:hypothetical protein
MKNHEKDGLCVRLQKLMTAYGISVEQRKRDRVFVRPKYRWNHGIKFDFTRTSQRGPIVDVS